MPMKRVYFYLAVSIFVMGIGIGIGMFVHQPQGVQVQFKGPTKIGSIGTPAIGGAFSLTNHKGQTVSDRDFRGRHLLVFFGYTYCPDICPTNLTNISDALDLLGDKAKNVQPIFVTVDPQRDTPEQLNMYVEHFHSSLVGLTGTAAQIKSISRAYKIYSAKAAQNLEDPELYLMDHTSLTYLMGPDGTYRTFIRHGATPEAIATKIKGYIVEGAAPAGR